MADPESESESNPKTVDFKIGLSEDLQKTLDTTLKSIEEHVGTMQFLYSSVREMYDQIVIARRQTVMSQSNLQLMAYAPKDREIFVYCPPEHGLSELISRVKWHPSAGFTVHELLEPLWWWEIPEIIKATDIILNIPDVDETKD